MKYCDCNEYCERAQWIIEKDGSKTGWFIPYVPEIISPNAPKCQMNKPGRTETREEYVERNNED